MAKNLTARQREVLETITTFCTQYGYPPSIRELGHLLNISSLRGVTIHLDALEKKGYIERERTSRSIRIVSQMGKSASENATLSIPLLGSIAAGTPLLAVENVESYVPIDRDMASGSRELFALKVKGDSMIGDHIVEGDVLIIQKQESADHNDIVAALIGDEATVKRLDIKTNPPRLLPSNPHYSPIKITGSDTRILGKVVGLVRSFDAS